MKHAPSILLALLLATASVTLQAQEQGKSFGISFSGFVKSDFFFDTRQSVSIREGHFLLYPAAENPDANGKDINAASGFNFLSIQTRLTGSIAAPDAFGAAVSGVIEADFFGNENAAFVDANGFRLRHAYARMKWASTELLFGQYWHALFIPRCFSDVISFNTGAPFQPFSRNPQVRFTVKADAVSFTAVAASQRDFASPGGSASLRNAAMPSLHALLQVEDRNAETKREFLAGAGGGYSVLRPLLQTEKGTSKFAADETVGGMTATAFALWRTADYALKVQGLYGQNVFDLTMLGGYAVSSVTDTATNAVAYAPLKTLSLWSEFILTGESVQFALWGGYTKNLGADDPIAFYSNKVNGTDATVRGPDIQSLWRLSPRIVYTSGKTSLALETEYTSAAYAAKDANGKLLRDANGLITETAPVANLRVLFAVILRF